MIIFSLDNGAKMSPKRRTFLSLVFASIYNNNNSNNDDDDDDDDDSNILEIYL